MQSFFNKSMSPSDLDDDAHRLQVATCALLLEAAHADDEFSADERKAVDGMIGRRFGLEPAETAELLELAESAREAAGGDLYGFARLINDAFPRPRKLAVLELLWRVVYSDGVLEAHEDALMHRLGNVLGIRHEELMALKARVRREMG